MPSSTQLLPQFNFDLKGINSSIKFGVEASPVASSSRNDQENGQNIAPQKIDNVSEELKSMNEGDIRLFVTGSGPFGQLGLGEDIVETKDLTLLPLSRSISFKSIACGSLINIAIDSEGKV